MVDIEVEFRRILSALDAAAIEYAVVGGFAVAIWGAPRATTDIDLLVREEDIDAILAVARALQFVSHAAPRTFPDGMRLRRVTRLEGEEMLTLDFLLVDENLEAAWNSRVLIETDVGPVRVVSRDALLQMKVAAGRPQDVADVARLSEMDR